MRTVRIDRYLPQKGTARDTRSREGVARSYRIDSYWSVSHLICMGSRVVLTLKSKRAVRVPGAYLYDPTGSLWPSCSLLFTTFSRLNEPATDAEMKGLPTWYFGRGYEGRVGKLSIPSKSLGEWTRVGEAIEIEYTRGGYRAPGRFFHPFGKRSIHTLFRKWICQSSIDSRALIDWSSAPGAA